MSLSEKLLKVVAELEGAEQRIKEATEEKKAASRKLQEIMGDFMRSPTALLELVDKARATEAFKNLSRQVALQGVAPQGVAPQGVAPQGVAPQAEPPKAAPQKVAEVAEVPKAAKAAKVAEAPKATPKVYLSLGEAIEALFPQETRGVTVSELLTLLEGAGYRFNPTYKSTHRQLVNHWLWSSKDYQRVGSAMYRRVR